MTLEESILDNIHSKKLGLPLSVLVSGAITYIVYGVLDVNGIQGYPVFKIVGSGNSTEYIAAGFLLESNRKDGANSSTADVNLKTDFENTLLLLQDPTIDYDGTGEFGYNPLDIPGLQLYLNKNLGVNTRVAAYFDGVNQYLSSASTDFNTTGSFSFGGWIYSTDLNKADPIMGKWGTGGRSYMLRREGDNTIGFFISSDGVDSSLFKSTYTTSLNTWHFVMGVYDSVNDLVKISFDGNSFENFPYTLGLYGSSTADLLFANFSGSGLHFNGRQDGMVFYNEALSLAEIQGLYNSGNGLAYNNVPTLLGTEYAIAQDFNGVDQYFSSASTAFDKTTESFSFGAWVKFDTLGVGVGTVGKWNTGTSQKSYLITKFNSNEIRLQLSSDGSSNDVSLISGTIATSGTWYFVAAVIDADNDLAKISVNGSDFATDTFSGGVFATNEDLFIGYNNANYLDGQIDSPFFYDKALSLAEVNALYNAGSGITHTNLPTLTGTEFGIGQSFNGTDSALNIDAVLTPLASTTTGTIEFDIKLTDATPTTVQRPIVFADADSGNNYVSIGVINTTGQLGLFLNGGSGNVVDLRTDAQAFTSGVWANVKIIQDGVSPKILIDDVEVAQTEFGSDPTKWFNHVALLDNGRIGCLNYNSLGNTEFMDGSIQNLKIYTDATQTNLVAHYPLNNVEGADQIDIVGGYDATPIGLPISTLASVDNTTITDMETDLTAWWEMNDVEGACQSNLADTTVDNAAVFNGTTDAINIDAVLTPLASTTTGTWEFDVKVTDATPTSATELVTFGDTNASTYIQTWLAPDGKININIVVGGVAQWWLKTDGIPLTANVWANLKFIQDGISPKIYINDILVAQTFTVSTDKTLWFNDIPLLDNGRVACINTNSLGDVGFFDGAMQNVKIYSDATQTTLIAHYDFADKDDLGNDIVGGYDGTLIGTPYATPLNGDLVPNNTPVSVLGKVTDTTLPNMETDLVSWWELNETSGTRLDEVGANNLTDNNSVGYALGKIQENAATSINDDKIAADFDGTNYLDGASNYLDFSTFDVLSIQFWVKRQGVGAAPTMLGVWNNGANNTWRFRMNSSANTFLEVSTDGSNSVTLSGGPITPFNAWNCVSIYINKPTKEIGFSLNGGAFITKSFTGNIFESGTPFTIGGLANLGAANLFTGEVDSVHFWSRQLTNSEFTDLYNSGNGLSYSDFSEPLLVDYYDGWLLNERSGTRTSINEVDLESNNNVGYDVGKITNPTQVETLVSRWLDQSPNMFVLSQNVVTRQPLLSADSIDFDGVDDYLNLAISDVFGADSSGIIFFSWYFDGVNGQTLLSSTDLTSTSQRMSFGIRTTGNLQVVGKSTNLTWTTASCVVGFNYGWVRSNGTSWDISLNGVPNQPLTVFSGTNNGNWFADILNRGSLTVGADIDPTPTYGTGQSVKTIYSNAALTDEQIAQIDNFMSQP